MRRLLLILAAGSLAGQSSISIKRQYDTSAVGVGAVVLTKEGIKIAEVQPGFSYFNGDGRAQLLSSHCSSTHSVSEEPATDSLGRYVLRMRPNPALLAVYRGGVRLEPTINMGVMDAEQASIMLVEAVGLEVVPNDGGTCDSN